MDNTHAIPFADKLDKLEAMLRDRGQKTLDAIGHVIEPNEVPLETLSANTITALRARVAELETAGCDVIDDVRSTFKARNGREIGIEDDSGEKCWIVGHEPIEALKRTLKGENTDGR